tara:strand:- start:2854 stop:4788 length:1935 start_codon:yes stop_codon:yes gene_type:complete
MPYTQFQDLDFGQIKTQIRNHLQANSNFTDFDFEGSNFSVLIDTLAYNTYINAFNANLAVNETFLDSATIRENVVSLARNIGYIPRSVTSAKASISFQVQIEDATSEVSHLTLNAGLVCIGSANDTSYRFSITDPITSRVYTDSSGNRVSDFAIEVTQGTFLRSSFVARVPSDQKFILDNENIDTSTIKVNVQNSQVGSMGREFKGVDNILNLNKDSEIYLIQEIQDEKVEILFGDGFFGKKLENDDLVTISYIVSNGVGSNGASVFDFQGSFTKPNGATIRPNAVVNITTVQSAANGSENEDIASIKYLSPRLYSAQYRAVTPRDYEAIIKTIYPATESIAVVGGEELSPPQFGKVQISIKPKNGTYVSDFDKQQIKNKLKNYAIAGINSEIIDLKMIYVEIDSTVYYNTSQVSDSNALRTTILDALEIYSNTVDINKFGGRFKYSKINQLIDRVDDSITSNITKVRIRRDLKALINQFAQYELCFGNRFHINPEGYNIKSTGFYISGWKNIVYLTDIPNTNETGKLDGSEKGVICLVSKDAKDELKIVAKDVGTVDYKKGEIILNTINITSTIAANNLIEVQAFPDSNDVIGLKDLYLNFDASNSTINMVKDVIASGEDVSGVVFSRDYYTSSYSNGTLERK